MGVCALTHTLAHALRTMLPPSQPSMHGRVCSYTHTSTRPPQNAATISPLAGSELQGVRFTLRTSAREREREKEKEKKSTHSGLTGEPRRRPRIHRAIRFTYPRFYRTPVEPGIAKPGRRRSPEQPSIHGLCLISAGVCARASGLQKRTSTRPPG